MWSVRILGGQQDKSSKVNNCRGVCGWSKGVNTYEVWKLDHCELSNTEQQADHCCVLLAGAQKNECRNDNVPHGRKAVEPDIFSFLICTSKPQRACHQNKTRDCHCEARLDHVHTNQKNCRHYDARDVIDDEVKDMAVDMGRMEADVEPPGNRAVNAVENLAYDEPEQSGADVAVNHGLKCDETSEGSACRKNVNAEPSPTLGLRCFSIWHCASLR